MRSRAFLFGLVIITSSLALPAVAYAGIPFFGPIIPPPSISGVPGSDVCAGSWGMLIPVINNIISFLLTIAIVFVAPLMIAYSGFLFVVNPVNSSGISEARSILTHTIVGIVIALAGWMIIAALMAVIYNANAKVEGGVLGTWSELITSNGILPCIDLKGSLNQEIIGTGKIGVSSGAGTFRTPPKDKTGTACDPNAVAAAARLGGYELTPSQANTFACIAMPESSCGAKNVNYKWGRGSTAAGAFQVLLQTHSECYDNIACRVAVGATSDKLDCKSGFRGGNPIPGSIVVDTCLKAAANLGCSTSAAACVLKKSNGSFSPWQADVNNAVQTGCIKLGG